MQRNQSLNRERVIVVNILNKFSWAQNTPKFASSPGAYAILLFIIIIIFAVSLLSEPVYSLVNEEFIENYEEQQRNYPGTFYMSGPDSVKEIALSFDDGPHPRYTRQILDILAEYNVKATFFLLGQEVEEHPWLVERIAREGHEIGNHSYTHRNFVRLTWDEIMEEEIKPTGELVENITGEYPELIRPPYGAISERQLERFSHKNYSIVNWSVDTGDYEEENNPELIMARTHLQLHPGAILLMHDGGGDRSNTVKMLPALIEMLEKEGFELTTVGELISQHSLSEKDN